MNPLKTYPILASQFKPLPPLTTKDLRRAHRCLVSGCSSLQFRCRRKARVLHASAVWLGFNAPLSRVSRNTRFDNWLLTEQMLRLLAQPDGSLLLALDWTAWQDRFSVLSASACVGTRAVPVASSACVKRQLARSQKLWEETRLAAVC